MKYYFIAIKGTGLSAMALLLHELGYEVSGYDDAKEHRFTEDELVKRGIKIYTEANDAMDQNTIVIYSTAIRENHPERKKAEELGLEMYEYHEYLGKLTEKWNTITVSGCHGKTTTTCMLAHVFDSLVGANYLIGDGTGHANTNNQYFMVEACEYKRHFLAYHPTYAIITNIEMDHTDYYKSMDDMILAYQSYANNASKMVIACGDDPYTHSLEVSKPIFFYGLKEDNDIIAKDIVYSNTGTSFDVFIEGEYYGHFDLPLYGKHMLLNALAVIAICHYERMNAKEVAKTLKEFKGAKRRFKEKTIGDIVIVDDYAHHPTEVKVTIKAAQHKYPDKKVIAIFKPHTFSRVQEFADDFAEALNIADKAYVMDINYDRELPEEYPGISADTIIQKLNNGGYMSLDHVDELLKYENAVLLFMSSKEIYVLEEEYERRLKEKMKVEC